MTYTERRPAGAVARRLAAAAAIAAFALAACEDGPDNGAGDAAGEAAGAPSDAAPPAEAVALDADGHAEGEEVAAFETLEAPAYVGVWAAEDGGSCGGVPGAGPDAPIAMTESEFIADAGLCILASAEEGTDGGWTLELLCQADGVEVAETVEADIDAGDDATGAPARMRLTRGGVETAYSRCE